MPLSPLLIHVNEVLDHANKRSWKGTVAEVEKLCKQFGWRAKSAACHRLLSELLSEGLGRSSSNHSSKAHVLGEICGDLAASDSFVALFEPAFENLPVGVDTSAWRSVFSSGKFSAESRLGVAVALALHPSSADRKQGWALFEEALEHLASSSSRTAQSHIGVQALVAVHGRPDSTLPDPSWRSKTADKVVAVFPGLAHGELHRSITGGRTRTSKASPSGLPVLESTDLSRYLMELGYPATASVGAFRATLAELGRGSKAGQIPLNAHEVAMMIAKMGASQPISGRKPPSQAVLDALKSIATPMQRMPATKASTPDGGWSAAVVAELLRKDFELLQWEEVVAGLDFPGCDMSSPQAPRFVAEVFHHARIPFPVDSLLRPWKNSAAQVGLLAFAVDADPALMPFNRAAKRIELVSGGSTSAGANGIWAAAELYNVLMHLAMQEGRGAAVTSMLNRAIELCPELLLLGLAYSKATAGVTDAVEDPNRPRSRLFYDLIMKFFQPLFASPERVEPSQLQANTMHRLWGISRPLALHALNLLYRTARPPPGAADVPPGSAESVETSFAAGREAATRVLMLAQTIPDAAATLLRPVHVAMCIDVAVAMALAVAAASLQAGGAVPATDPSTGRLRNLPARAETFQLNRWLSGQLQAQGNAGFPEALAVFLRRASASQAATLSAAEVATSEEVRARILSLAVPADVVVVFLKVLRSYLSGKEGPLAETLRQAGQACGQVFPAAMGLLVASRVEAAATELLTQIHKSALPLGDGIKRLLRLRTSGSADDALLLVSFVQNLYEEYRHFGKHDQDSLRLIGILYGQIVANGLVQGQLLKMGVQYVLSALAKDPRDATGSKLFFFARVALHQFRQLLRQLPQFASSVAQLPHVRSAYPQFVAEASRVATAVAAARQGQAVAEASLQVNASLLSAEEEAAVARLLGAGSEPELMASASAPAAIVGGSAGAGGGGGGGVAAEPAPAPAVSPPDAVQETLTFIVNNLTEATVTDKSREAKRALKEEWHPWFAQFLVYKRISTQLNFHEVYSQFLEALGSDDLMLRVRITTVERLRALLSAGRTRNTTKDRTLVKNLGSWLGRITLGKDKPLLHLELDVKELLFVAYETGRLMAVMSFVAKLLDAGKNSRVFRASNPWVKGLLRTLRELYDVPDLKLNLKFEVELLCKNLSVDLQAIVPSEELHKRRQPVLQGNADFSARAHRSNLPGIITDEVVAAAQAAGSTHAASTVNRGTTLATAGHGSVPLPGGDQLRDYDNPPQPPPASGASSVATSSVPAAVAAAGSAGLAAMVSIPPSMAALQERPDILAKVTGAVTQAWQELLTQSVPRAARIASITTKELVLRDFSLESDPRRLALAARLMVSNLASSLALVTTQDQLKNALKARLSRALEVPGDAPHPTVDALVLANVDAGRRLVETAATEQAMADLDQGMRTAIMERQHAVQQGKRHYDEPSPHARWPTRLPAPLRPAPDALTAAQLQVYDAFSRPAAATAAAAATGGEASAGVAVPSASAVFTGQQALAAYQHILSALPQACSSHVAVSPGSVTLAALQGTHEVVLLLKRARSVSQQTQAADKDAAGVEFGVSVLKLMYATTARKPGTPADQLLLQAYLALLVSLRDATSQELQRRLTELVVKMVNPQEPDFVRDVPVALLRSGLLVTPAFDKHIAACIGSGTTGAAVQYAMQIINKLVLTDSTMTPRELSSTVAALRAVHGTANSATRFPHLPALLQAVSDVADRANLALAAASTFDAPTLGRVVAGGGGKDASDDFRKQAHAALREWLRIRAEAAQGAATDPEAAPLALLRGLKAAGVFDDSKASEKWVRVCTEIAVEGCQASGVVGSPNAGASSAAAISYTSVDAWHSLLMFLAKNIPEDAARSSMLNRALAVVFTALSTDADACRLEPDAGRAFDQRPYLRLLTGILADCLGPGAEAPLQALDVQVLTSYASLLHSVQPERVPGFSFAWVELFSHRLFLPRLLQLPEQRGWPIVHTLLADLLRFQYPYLQNAELTEGLRLLYRTTLRVLLVLLHDFPDFLAEHHFALCNAIPPSCVQMRNLILSAFPRDIQLPDPFAPDLKIDLLPQITVHPRVRSAVASALPVDESEVAAYLRKRSPSHFPASLITTLGVTDDAREAPGTRFSAAAIHALVLTVGTLDLRLAEEAAGGKLAASAITAQVQRSAAMDIFRRLITSLPPDGRAMLISSIANQLRYPNAHTHYFSCVLLVLFVEASSDDIREQITRLLLERLIVHRPHPWGLLITVIELMKNPRYKLWSYDFTRCAPEIERLLDSVARSCNAKTEASEA